MGRRDERPSCPRCAELERDNRQLQGEVERLERDNQRLAARLAGLSEALEAARRAGKRQAAPFSKGEPKTTPRRPGRRPGAEHGPAAYRPPPERIDEILEAPLPECCPRCGGVVVEERVASQFQAEVPPVVPWSTQIRVHIGHCQDCGLRVQGRHPRQTSDALGAAASQVGPRVLALAADLNQGLGLSLAKSCRVLQRAFGLRISRGGLYLGLERLARAAEPTYHTLIEQIRGSPWVSPDETGWKLGGVLVWLWAFATETLTVYAIHPGRGFAEAAAVLGEDFGGILGKRPANRTFPSLVPVRRMRRQGGAAWHRHEGGVELRVGRGGSGGERRWRRGRRADGARRSFAAVGGCRRCR